MTLNEDQIAAIIEKSSRMREALPYMPAGRCKLKMAVMIAQIDMRVSRYNLMNASDGDIRSLRGNMVSAINNLRLAQKALEEYDALEDLKNQYA